MFRRGAGIMSSGSCRIGPYAGPHSGGDGRLRRDRPVEASYPCLIRGGLFDLPQGMKCRAARHAGSPLEWSGNVDAIEEYGSRLSIATNSDRFFCRTLRKMTRSRLSAGRMWTNALHE